MRWVLVMVFLGTVFFGCAGQEDLESARRSVQFRVEEDAVEANIDLSGEPVARVNDWQISLAELGEIFRSMEEEAAAHGVDFGHFEVRRRFLDQMVQREVLYRAGQMLGLEDDEQARQMPLEVRKDAIAQIMRSTIMADVEISEEDKRDFYQQNEEFFALPFEESKEAIKAEIDRFVLHQQIGFLLEELGDNIQVEVNYDLLEQL